MCLFEFYVRRIVRYILSKTILSTQGNQYLQDKGRKGILWMNCYQVVYYIMTSYAPNENISRVLRENAIIVATRADELH